MCMHSLTHSLGGSPVVKPASCLQRRAAGVLAWDRCGLLLPISAAEGLDSKRCRKLGHSLSWLPWVWVCLHHACLVPGLRLSAEEAEGPRGFSSRSLERAAGGGCAAQPSPVSGSLSRGP